METIYKGFLITEVYAYTNGKSDFHIFPAEGSEEGMMRSKTTLEQIKSEIDEIDELKDWNVPVSLSTV